MGAAEVVPVGEEARRGGEQAPGGSPAVPDRVAASWRRSADYGVAERDATPVFAGTAREGSLFSTCGREVLADLHRTLVDEPLGLVLTDADGLVLDRLSGDTSLLRSLDAVHLAPGFAFSEREAGTSGLGLALADRLPALVRASQHYSADLTAYTCAAVPVLDPLTGRLEGSVNITTWSASSGQLLLALAQSAASATGALMLARSRGRSARPAPRGEVFRVLAPRPEPGAGTVTALSAAWTDAVAAAEAAVRAGRLTAAVGEPGSGRATLLAQALRRAHPRDRVLDVRPPAPEDVDAWLGLWAPEAAKPATTVVLRDVDALSVATADRVRDVLAGGGGPAPRVVVTAEDLGDVAPPLARLVASVVRVAPLRERPDDVLPLAAHAARRARGREVDLTPAAARALAGHAWPGGVEQLQRVVRRAASLADRVDVGQLPPEVLTGAGRSLTRLERVERDEIVRVLTRPGTTVVGAARELGLSRATLYRRIAHLGLEVPR